MRKILILGFAAVLAVLTLGFATGSANAAPAPRTATFTAIQPAQDYGQFGNVWRHVFTVQVNADGTFSGTGVISGHDNVTTMTNAPETVTGTINADGTISLVAGGRTDGVVWSLTNAIADGNTVNPGTLVNPNIEAQLEFKVTAPIFTGNHGDCVSGATHAGIKGKALAAIAQDNTKVGEYGSSTCPAVS